jgi:alkyl hydroperoxide reductase subunit AhpC
MALKLGDTVPDFTADSTEGPIEFYKYIEGSWAILFSHPNDFTPVCTTELGAVGNFLPEFEKRGVKVIALSCNDVVSHKGWIGDIESYTPGAKVGYPILADPTRELAVKFGMLDPDEIDSKGIPLTARAVFIIGPDKKLKLSILYPATTGRRKEPSTESPALTGGGNCGVKDSPWGSIGGPSPPDRGFTQSGCQASTAPDRFSKIVLGVGLFENACGAHTSGE